MGTSTTLFKDGVNEKDSVHQLSDVTNIDTASGLV